MNAVLSDVTCGVFSRLSALDTTKVHRFIVGVDSAPVALTDAQVADQLGDAFAELLLRKGVFPQTAAEVASALDAATADSDPLRVQTTFILGEGSQISTGDVQRNIRFLATRGTLGGVGPDVILSTPDPDATFIELMAWDNAHQGFNYYRTVEGAWVFAGNSRHALEPSSRLKGPFESHPSGNVIMKELRFPWVHWHSFAANFLDSTFAADGRSDPHGWFAAKRGAETLETQVVMPSVQRWTKARFDAFPAGAPDGPGHLMRQVLSILTVNLVSGKDESRKAQRDGLDLPPAFFADAETFDLLGLELPPKLSAPGPVYTQALRDLEVHLADGGSFTRPGDTHFPFVVPERSFEDIETIRVAIERGVLTDRFVACLLMTDFPNPVFSDRRESLLAHVPQGIDEGALGSFAETMANAIVDAAPGTPVGSPELEFAERWGAGDAWRETFGAILKEYYEAIQARVGTQNGFDDYIRLAESRRNLVRGMPIFESNLLFAETNIPRDERLVMKPDGTVAAV